MESRSKSSVKAAGCQVFFQRGRDNPLKSPINRAGVEFHEFADAYMHHLKSEGLEEDPGFSDKWISTRGLLADSIELIRKFVDGFVVDPDAIVGIESFLVVDEFFEPIPGVKFPGYGKSPDHPSARLHGTLDLILKYGNMAIIKDWKTGWNPRPSRIEAMIYAALVFAHYPDVKTVVFEWVQVRLGASEEMAFERDTLANIIAEVSGAIIATDEAAETDDPDVNPFAGQCAWCAVEDCPVRKYGVANWPIQTPSDAVTAAEQVEALKHRLSDNQSNLKRYIEEHGPLEVRPGVKVHVQPKESDSFPLLHFLEALGFDVPEDGVWRDPFDEAVDLPLQKLQVKAIPLVGYLKAEKRTGLRERLRPVKGYRRELVITEEAPEAGPVRPATA